MTETTAKTTPLHSQHSAAGARFVEFSGWRMPVQYTGIIEEHHAVRNAAGLFDISHMGQLRVSGEGAAKSLNRILSNNIDRLQPGECHYTFLLNESGGILDDLIVYRSGENEFLLVVNAGPAEDDFRHLEQHLDEGVTLENRSAESAGLALQGPRAGAIFDRFFGQDTSRPPRNAFRTVERAGVKYVVARTGYTGEDGFEFFLPADAAGTTWEELLDLGAAEGLKPCGLGARDTLRLEMCYPLNGSDLTPAHSPLEAGLSIFVDLDKPEFIGREALQKQKAQGITRRLVPFRMTGKSPPPRPHYPVLKDGRRIAETTSGNLSPTLGAGIGMAYLPPELARVNETIEIEIRGRSFPAIIEKKPLHRPQ